MGYFSSLLLIVPVVSCRAFISPMNQELINQIIKQLETLSLESVRLTQEMKALQETTGTINNREEK